MIKRERIENYCPLCQGKVRFRPSSVLRVGDFYCDICGYSPPTSKHVVVCKITEAPRLEVKRSWYGGTKYCMVWEEVNRESMLPWEEQP